MRRQFQRELKNVVEGELRRARDERIENERRERIKLRLKIIQREK